MNDLAPLDMLERMLRRWWVVALLILLCGAAGFGFTRLRPAIYEATGEYMVSLNQEQLVASGKVTATEVPLSFSASDAYLSAVADMFTSDEVMTRLNTDAQAQGVLKSGQNLNAADLYLDRRGLRWLLSARASTPKAAASLVNLWMTATDAALQEAQAHAVLSQSTQLAVESIQKCLVDGNFSQANQCAGTSFSSLSDLQNTINTQQQKVITEQAASHGIDPALGFSIVSPAETPTHAVLYGTSLVTLAGALIGLLVGLLMVQFMPARMPKK